MKLKFSILTILLFFLSASFPLAAQKAPQPFDIDTPSLRVFLPAPELATGRAIVACPGGGYGGLAVNHEGYDWAPYFNKQGIALIVLKYRMPHGDRTLPISDAEAAMKMARDSADVWNLNPYDIGIMGSSAGGHGMTREDFTIKIENNNQLVVSMEKKHEQKEDKKEEGRYLRREFSYTRFQQAMILPDDVVKEKIQARMEHGVLTIDIPKQTVIPEEKNGRTIEIK